MRIQKLQQTMKRKDIDLALFFALDSNANSNMLYLANYSGLGILVVLKTRSFLIVPDMEYEKAKKSGIKLYKAYKKKRLLETLSLLLKNQEIKKIGIEQRVCSVHIYKSLRRAIKARFVDISSYCMELRMIKDKSEIDKIMKACAVTDYVLSRIVGNFKFETEQDIKKFIEIEILQKDCELAFPPIVASGKSSSIAHYDSSKRISRGFLMLDFGARYQGYCSDMTRMLYIGTPTAIEIEDYNSVLNVLLECESMVKKELKVSKLYSASVTKLGNRSAYFTHSLGHGLGLDIHEQPALYIEDKSRIMDNMIFTIEPGIYFPNRYGIRIEDTMLFENGSLKILTKSSKVLKNIFV